MENEGFLEVVGVVIHGVDVHGREGGEAAAEPNIWHH